MSTPDSTSASQLCKYFRHILGKYSQRAQARVYNAQLLVSISHESFTAGQRDLQCSRDPTWMWKRPHWVLKHLHGEWHGRARREQLPATVTVCKYIRFRQSVHITWVLKSQNRWPTPTTQLYPRMVSHFMDIAVRGIHKKLISQSLGWLLSLRIIWLGNRGWNRELCTRSELLILTIIPDTTPDSSGLDQKEDGVKM